MQSTVRLVECCQMQAFWSQHSRCLCQLRHCASDCCRVNVCEGEGSLASLRGSIAARRTLRLTRKTETENGLIRDLSQRWSHASRHCAVQSSPALCCAASVPCPIPFCPVRSCPALCCAVLFIQFCPVHSSPDLCYSVPFVLSSLVLYCAIPSYLSRPVQSSTVLSYPIWPSSSTPFPITSSFRQVHSPPFAVNEVTQVDTTSTTTVQGPDASRRGRGFRGGRTSTEKATPLWGGFGRGWEWEAQDVEPARPASTDVVDRTASSVQTTEWHQTSAVCTWGWRRWFLNTSRLLVHCSVNE